MAAASYTKDPNTTRSYTLDYVDHLAAGATIETSEWEIPDGLTQVGTATQAGTTTEVKISGGTAGTSYAIYNLVESSDGLSERRSIILQVVDAALIREPSDLEQQLSQVRTALGQKAANDTQEYQIANRLKRRYSFEDLLAWEKRLTELVSAERRAVGGPGFFKNHLVRPVEPGP